MRSLYETELPTVSGGGGEGGDGLQNYYSMGDLANALSTESVQGLTLGDTALIAGVISAAAFSAAAIPGPTMLAFTFVGLTTAGIGALLAYIDAVNNRK